MTKHISRRHMLGSGIAVSAAFVAACGGNDDDTSSRQTEGTTVAGSAAGTAGAARQALPAELVVANELEPADLGPYHGGYPAQLVTRQVYEALVQVRMTLDATGAAKLTPVAYLAESWQRVEPLRWRFKLRPGVTFHNGEPWNASAAKFSFDTMADAKVAASVKKPARLIQDFSGCEIVDDMTIDMVTKVPNNEALQRIGSGFTAIPPQLTQDKGVEHLFENPTGTGPFAFKSWQRGGDLKLEKYGSYWNARAVTLPASIKYLIRRETAVRAQMVKAGEAHVAYNIGAEQAAGLKTTAIGGGFQSNSLRVNNTLPITGDVRVRQAMNHALDRQAIAKSIFRGSAQPIGFFGFQPVKVDPFAYKPEEARKLIDAAGARGATLDLVYGEGRIPEEDQLAEVFKASLEAVGLKIQIKKVEPRVYDETGGRPFPEQPPLYMETTSSGNFGEIISGLRDKYGCKGTGTFCKPELDAEYELLPTLDEGARVAKLQSIAERLQFQETPRVWVVVVQQVHGFADFITPDLPLNVPFFLQDLRTA